MRIASRLRATCRLSLLPLLLLLSACEREADFSHPVPERPDFVFDVKPLLSDRCFACHGPDETKQKAGMALHTPERALAELEGQPGKFAIVPGDPEASELYRRITSRSPDIIMPPPESHLSLAPHEIELLRRWIEQGAEYRPHWAFQAPGPVAVPEVGDADWCRNPVDNFVRAKLTARGLTPAPAADRYQLLRRVTFDLTGLPPTAAEIEAFVNDPDPDAYERVVDRLLASPHYGERMATDWLDLARYADSHGYQDDRPRTMWPWRDWVIGAYNRNLSYRDFVTWQLAGDLLEEPTYEQLLATGFNRNNPVTQEGGILEAEYLAEYASDRTHVFSTAFLGLTVECAKCHTHKYDPILHRDYYQLVAFFDRVPERGHISLYDEAPVPNLRIEDPALESEIAAVTDYIARLEDRQRELEESADLPTDLADPAETLQRGLIAHYAFDRVEGSRTASSLPDGPDGWLNYKLPPTFADVVVTTGKTGGALQFDGKNYVSLGRTGDFEHHMAFSAAAWIRDDGRATNTRAIFGKRMDELRHNGYDLVLTPERKLAFRLSGFWWQPGSYVDGLGVIEVRTTAPVAAGRWQHVAVVYDGSGRAAGITLYVDGRSRPLETVYDNLNQHTLLNGNDLALGNYNQRGRNWGESLQGFVGGRIDEFRLYERELSPLEVAHLADPAPGPQSPGTSPRIASAFRTTAAVRKHGLLHHHADYRRNLEQLDSLRAIDRRVPSVMIMRDDTLPRTTFIRLRGAYDQPGDSVQPLTPASVLPLDDDYPRNRLGLARWLFDPAHPLTARVAVNRLWQQCFGRGIVATPADFGNQGKLPTHPQLLDWLANHYRSSCWDTKALLRLLVTSATYRQDATLTPAATRADPDNRWLARGPGGKLTAEMLRDQALAASGLLYDRVGGKWVKPHQPPGLWNEMASDIGEPVYRPDRGRNRYRRSLYTYFKRTIPPPDMLTLDAAARDVCTVQRQRTSTPLQSLVVMNAPVFHEAAGRLVGELAADGLSGVDLLAAAFLRIVGRPATVAELSILTESPAADPALAVSLIINLDEAQRK